MSDLFEEKSRDWDQNERVLAISRAVGDAVLRHADLRPGDRVLDFGAGTGLICGRIAPRVQRMVAVDISQSMLDQLARKPELQGCVETRCQDILDCPLDERFDLIVSAMAMHHVEDTDRLARSLFGHLLPGGRIALADLDAEDGYFHDTGPDTEGVYHHGFDREDLARRFAEAGFEDIRFETAHVVRKHKDYPIFLMLARRPED